MRIPSVPRGVLRAACVSLAMLLLSAGTSDAGGCGCPACVAGFGPSACQTPRYQVVERTVYVPTTVMEQRTVNVTVYRPEVKERTVMVSRCVPETREVRETYHVLVPEVHTKTYRYQVQRPVWREEERDVNVMVPHDEVRQGVRHVCRPVQVQEMRSVTRDQGHYEEVVCQDDCYGDGCGYGVGRRTHRFFARGCGGCDDCGAGYGKSYDAGCGGAPQHVHRVWRCNLVTEQVPVNVWRSQVTEEPYEYRVTVYRPEVRRQRFRVCEYVTEERTKDVEYVVCRPEPRERTRNVTTYRMVSEARQQTYTVQVPHRESREITVPVCRMVAKQVTCRVPVYDHGPGCVAGCCP